MLQANGMGAVWTGAVLAGLIGIGTSTDTATAAPEGVELAPVSATDTATGAAWWLPLVLRSVGEGASTEQRFDAAPMEAGAPSVKVGGALRFNALYRTWNANADSPDRVGFDTFRLDVDARYEALRLSAEYRFYSGYHFLHHGYVAYVQDDFFQVQAGVSQVPFGILPYASHNYFFGLNYYVGLEDDYDLGAQVIFEQDGVDIRAAFYKNDVGHFSGSSIDSARFSYDIVQTTPDELPALDAPRTDQETNQFNVRMGYDLPFTDTATVELGASVQVGELFNRTSQETGHHWAVAAHADADIDAFNVQLQATRFRYAPRLPESQDPGVVVLGAWDAPYLVAAEGWLLLANVAYEWKVGAWLLDSVTFYNDFSALLKLEDRFADSFVNTTGMLLATGPLYTYVDAVVAQNHPWIGPTYGSALAEGHEDPDQWHARFNVNVGWYF